MAIECPGCGSSSDERFSFCGNCGTELRPAPPEPRICTACGTEVPDGFGFCRECGAPVDSTRAAARVPITASICASCGHASPAAYRFCELCGTPLPASEATTAPVRTETRPRVARSEHARPGRRRRMALITVVAFAMVAASAAGAYLLWFRSDPAPWTTDGGPIVDLRVGMQGFLDQAAADVAFDPASGFITRDATGDYAVYDGSSWSAVSDSTDAPQIRTAGVAAGTFVEQGGRLVFVPAEDVPPPIRAWADEVLGNTPGVDGDGGAWVVADPGAFVTTIGTASPIGGRWIPDDEGITLFYEFEFGTVFIDVRDDHVVIYGDDRVVVMIPDPADPESGELRVAGTFTTCYDEPEWPACSDFDGGSAPPIWHPLPGEWPPETTVQIEEILATTPGVVRTDTGFEVEGVSVIEIGEDAERVRIVTHTPDTESAETETIVITQPAGSMPGEMIIRNRPGSNPTITYVPQPGMSDTSIEDGIDDLRSNGANVGYLPTNTPVSLEPETVHSIPGNPLGTACRDLPTVFRGILCPTAAVTHESLGPSTDWSSIYNDALRDRVRAHAEAQGTADPEAGAEFVDYAGQQAWIDFLESLNWACSSDPNDSCHDTEQPATSSDGEGSTGCSLKLSWSVFGWKNIKRCSSAAGDEVGGALGKGYKVGKQGLEDLGNVGVRVIEKIPGAIDSVRTHVVDGFTFVWGWSKEFGGDLGDITVELGKDGWDLIVTGYEAGKDGAVWLYHLPGQVVNGLLDLFAGICDRSGPEGPGMAPITAGNAQLIIDDSTSSGDPVFHDEYWDRLALAQAWFPYLRLSSGESAGDISRIVAQVFPYTLEGERTERLDNASRVEITYTIFYTRDGGICGLGKHDGDNEGLGVGLVRTANTTGRCASGFQLVGMQASAHKDLDLVEQVWQWVWSGFRWLVEQIPGAGGLIPENAPYLSKFRTLAEKLNVTMVSEVTQDDIAPGDGGLTACPPAQSAGVPGGFVVLSARDKHANYFHEDVCDEQLRVITELIRDGLVIYSGLWGPGALVGLLLSRGVDALSKRLSGAGGLESCDPGRQPYDLSGWVEIYVPEDPSFDDPYDGEDTSFEDGLRGRWIPDTAYESYCETAFDVDPEADDSTSAMDYHVDGVLSARPSARPPGTDCDARPVPRVTGLTESAARARIEGAGFEARRGPSIITECLPSDRAGLVAEQDPPYPSTLSPGGLVTYRLEIAGDCPTETTRTTGTTSPSAGSTGTTGTTGTTAPSGPTCNGVAATIVGTEGPDSLYGTDGPDVIVGLGGSDGIEGGGGDDMICGGDGDDWLEGDAGNDYFEGGAGDDIISGGDGNDSMWGGTGDDSLEGGPGDDWILGKQGADFIDGGPGTDTSCVQAEDFAVDIEDPSGAC